VARTQRIKAATYRIFYRFVAPLLDDSFLAIRVKWFVALKLVGLEFHIENITKNHDKLLHYANPECRLNEQIVEVVSKFNEETIAMLDAGCGPFSKAGNRLAGKVIIKELLDPLAKEYEAIYDQLRLPNRPRIKRGFIERLDDFYPSDSFHIIHVRNCIDHCYNPILVIEKMIKALKPGGASSCSILFMRVKMLPITACISGIFL
jgi:SAM-dependent methyltransferase